MLKEWKEDGEEEGHELNNGTSAVDLRWNV